MAPTLTSQASSTWSDSASTDEVTTGALSWNSGDRILVLGLTENSTFTLNTPTATGLTFSALGSPLLTTNEAWMHAWQATAGSSGSGNITGPVGEVNSAMRGIWCSAWGNCNGFVRTNAQNVTGQTLSVTRTQANSAMAMAAADWNAVGIGGLTGWTPAGYTQVQAEAHADVTAFAAYWGDQGATGTTSYGTTGLSGTRSWTQIAVEILEAAAAAVRPRPPIVSPGWAVVRAANY